MVVCPGKFVIVTEIVVALLLAQRRFVVVANEDAVTKFQTSLESTPTTAGPVRVPLPKLMFKMFVADVPLLTQHNIPNNTIKMPQKRDDNRQFIN
jgi:hypothetical protein